MMRPSTVQAVRNNAEWCDAVCRAHGVAGSFSEHLWVSAGVPPPYYPNIITLAPSSPALVWALARAIEGARSEAGPGVSVKDSFGDMDLTSSGFRVLFEGEWFGRPGTVGAARSAGSGAPWTTVRTESDLAVWKQAWDAPILEVDPVFLPPLLHDENVLFMWAKRGDDIVAGAIANRHAEAIGLSNYFARGRASASYGADCVSVAMALFPGLPVVGYEQHSRRHFTPGTEFTTLGPLRVWVTDETP